MNWPRILVVVGLVWFGLALLKQVRRAPRDLGRIKAHVHAAAMVGNVPLENLPASAVQVWRDEDARVKLQLAPPLTRDDRPILEP